MALDVGAVVTERALVDGRNHEIRISRECSHTDLQVSVRLFKHEHVVGGSTLQMNIGIIVELGGVLSSYPNGF